MPSLTGLHRAPSPSVVHLTLAACVVLLATTIANAVPCPDGCTKNGTCNEELGRCDCPRHRTGRACETELDLVGLAGRCRDVGHDTVEGCVSPTLSCPNLCSHRGTCVAGWCHCREGYFGADCSLSMGKDGVPQVLADRGYKPRSRGPRVYMYELPPDMWTWRNYLRLDRPTAHFFMERITATGVRTGDGDNADWYFLPIVLRKTSDGFLLNEAIRYVAQVHPWWNQTAGHRHFVFALGDAGRVESERGPLARNVTFVSHWGAYNPRPFSHWPSSHRNATDVVLPVFLGANKLQRMGIFTSRNHPKYMTKAKPELRERNGHFFFFAGRICGDHSTPRLDGVWPHCVTQRSSGYSGGIRQLVHFHHWNRTGYFIQMGDREYGKSLLTSKYCFGPMGGGHGQRQMQAALAGCVPVVISDGVLEAFEPYLDWNDFGVRVLEKDIPRMHEILEAITPQEYERKVTKLRCAAQHIAFSTYTGAYMGESGRYDAYETLLEVLRAKAAHPHAAPEELRRLDPRFDAFMDCRDDEGEEEQGALALAAARSGKEQYAAETDSGEEGSAEEDGEQEAQKRVQEARRSSRRVMRGGGSSGEGQEMAVGSVVGRGGMGAGHRVRASRVLAAAAGAAGNGTGPSMRKAPLCSVSPFDAGDSDAVMCGQLIKGYRRAYGGLMCAWSPEDMASCPRPWA